MTDQPLTIDDVVPDLCPTCLGRRWRDEIKHGVFYFPQGHTVTWTPFGDRYDVCPVAYRN